MEDYIYVVFEALKQLKMYRNELKRKQVRFSNWFYNKDLNLLESLVFQMRLYVGWWRRRVCLIGDDPFGCEES